VNDRYSSSGNKFSSRCGLFNVFLFFGLLHIAKCSPYSKLKITDTELGFFSHRLEFLVWYLRQDSNRGYSMRNKQALLKDHKGKLRWQLLTTYIGYKT